jgi:ubiquinone biosynthesis accessory factor UbiJ
LRLRLPSAKATPAVAFSFFVNHVLDGAAWARARLVPFAGRIVEVRVGFLPPLLFAIKDDGRLVAGGGEPAAIVSFTPRRHISGDPALAAELEHLARHLRWDVEEDLSRLFGDVLAHRLAQAARRFTGWQRDSAARLGETLADYMIEEARLVVRRAELEELAAAAARLQSALERLEQRIARLG